MTKAITRDNEGHDIMIMGSIQQEDITFRNMHAPNIGAPKYINQILADIRETLIVHNNSREL